MVEDEFEATGTSVSTVETDPEVQKLIVLLSNHLDEDTDLSSFADGTKPNTLQVYSRLKKNPHEASALYHELETLFESEEDSSNPSLEPIRDVQGPIPGRDELRCGVEQADACRIQPQGVDGEGTEISVNEEAVDLIVTSPPYWKKRNYGVEGQLGQESNPADYIENLVDALDQWRPFLRSTGSIFLNLGDTYKNKSLVGIPGRFASKARDAGWTIRNNIVWAKSNGLPSPAKDRLVSRHEHIFHLTKNNRGYYYDLFGYSQVYGNGSNPGDVWYMNHDQNKGGHLAPFPEDLARRAITLACPPAVCPKCGEPRRRQLERGLLNLNESREQARRALEIYRESDELTKDHIRAIQATGISDAGKAKQIQSETGGNAEGVEELATEAKEILGGYFREFTFPQWETESWSRCDCDVDPEPGMVLDPFAGSGTTLKVAHELGYHSWGTDLDTTNFQNPLTNF
jgi:DNA modification methylase